MELQFHPTPGSKRSSQLHKSTKVDVDSASESEYQGFFLG